MRAFAIAAVLVLGLCAAAAAQAPTENPPEPGIADGSLQRRLDDARRRWKAAGLQSYRYDIRHECFCPPQKTTLVLVRNNRVKIHPTGLRKVATVNGLFRFIQSAIDAAPVQIRVRYGRRGVPERIYVDWLKVLADEETGYAISRFTPLKPRGQ